jgi:hypothetical protein
MVENDEECWRKEYEQIARQDCLESRYSDGVSKRKRKRVGRAGSGIYLTARGDLLVGRQKFTSGGAVRVCRCLPPSRHE